MISSFCLSLGLFMYYLFGLIFPRASKYCVLSACSQRTHTKQIRDLSFNAWKNIFHQIFYSLLIYPQSVCVCGAGGLSASLFVANERTNAIPKNIESLFTMNISQETQREGKRTYIHIMLTDDIEKKMRFSILFY